MASRNKVLFEDLANELSNETTAERKRATGYLQERQNHLAQLTGGELVEKALLWVDPERCRMWFHHNRRYDLLDESCCADLIQGIKAQGRQEFPAIVRRLEDDSGYDYEVICGARRHWAITWLRQHNYPQFKFLIEVRRLTDEEAFRLSDSENRDREDISDYERALDYRKAMELYYHSQKAMAQRLEVSETWLSRYLDLASLPEEIVQAYPSIAELKVHHARELKPLLKDPLSRRRLLERAAELSLQQQQARQVGQTLLNGAQILRCLKTVIKKRSIRQKQSPIEYRTPTGQCLLTAVRRRQGGLLIEVLPRTGASKEELLEALTKVFSDHEI